MKKKTFFEGQEMVEYLLGINKFRSSIKVLNNIHVEIKNNSEYYILYKYLHHHNKDIISLFFPGKKQILELIINSKINLCVTCKNYHDLDHMRDIWRNYIIFERFIPRIFILSIYNTDKKTLDII